MYEGGKAERWEGAKPVIRGGRRTEDTTIARLLFNEGKGPV
jgi:hypothetical protein